ncbi:hypothetical protein JD969_05540 [Planctomycetota bacterium]|nr:hypothetical protein JD969_05540 [Planctomycetota bacterium]
MKSNLLLVPILLTLTFLISGCISTAHSTRLQLDDFNEVSNQITAQLAASDFLRSRSPYSPPMNITFEKVTNLSGDIFTQAEEWAIMKRIFSAMPIQQLEDQFNIRIILPSDRTREIAKTDINDEAANNFGSQRQVTHIMTATINSVTRNTKKQRTDLYAFFFQIDKLTSPIDRDNPNAPRDTSDLGTIVWSGKFEIKRAAVGNIRN